MRSLVILGAAALWLVLGALTAAAQTAGAFPCGRVAAYVPPTASTPGSITLGTSRFEVAPGSAPDRQIAVGSDLCIDGDRNAAGTYTRVIVTPMGPGVCGVVTAYSAPSTSAAGSITLSSARGIFTLPVASGVTLAREQVTGGQCFGFGVNSQGNAEVFRYSAPWDVAPVPSSLAASPTVPGLPSTSVASTDGPAATGSIQQRDTTTPLTTPVSPSQGSPVTTAALAVAIAALAAGALVAARVWRAK